MMSANRSHFYCAYNSLLDALDEEEYDELIEQIKLPKVVAFNVECYPVYSETIATIFNGNSKNSLFFAILYKGWPLDSKSNPTKVAAIFREQHNSTSTCSGAVVPCHIIDENGLIPQVSQNRSSIYTDKYTHLELTVVFFCSSARRSLSTPLHPRSGVVPKSLHRMQDSQLLLWYSSQQGSQCH